MKKVMVIILFILSMGLAKTTAQEKTMPMDSTMLRDNMTVPMEKVPSQPMDIAPIERDKTRMDNMPIMRDTTPMERDKMQRGKKPQKVDADYNRKMNETVNRMNRDSAREGRYFWDSRRDTVLNGIYNGQRIRSDTVRNGTIYNGMRLEDMPNYKKIPKNKKELDGTQNGKYNYETSRDSMPDAKNIDPYRKKYNPKYGDKMARNSAPPEEQKMRALMAKEDRGVMMHRGRTMIVKNGQKTFIKSYTYLSFGTKVMSDGTIIKQDGTKTMMKDGEFVNMMGEIVPMKER
jgi:hypothetical protein